MAAPGERELRAARRHEPTWLYRCFDADGVLLYIGQTRVPYNRMAVWRNDLRHPHPRRKSAAWFALVRRIDWRLYPDWWAARDAERDAIRAERPLHNVQHNLSLAVVA